MKRANYTYGEAPIKIQKIDEQWLQDFITKNEIGIETRPYQARIVVKAVNFFLDDYDPTTGKHPINSILVESATGSGKTVIGLLLARVLNHILSYETTWTTLRRNLLRQARSACGEFNFQVPMTTVSMLEKEPTKNDILIVDEAHHDSTTSMANIHSKVKPKLIVLLSATPIRADKATIFYQKHIKDSGIRALIRDGYLSKFDLFMIDNWSPKVVAENYLREKEKWGKTCVFFHQYAQCVEFKQLLAAEGVECEVVTGQTDRDAQIARLLDGEVDVLVNMMVLTEGFDCPALETVFVRPSYKGSTVQMAGRVLRLYKGLVKNIVQSKDTKYPFSREADARHRYLRKDDDWQEIGVNKKVDQMVSSSIAQITENAHKSLTRKKKFTDYMKNKKRQKKANGFATRM